MRPSLFALLLALGCGSASSSSSSSGSSSSSSSGPAATTTGSMESPQPIDLDPAWISQLEGSWIGPVDPTPIGPIPTFPVNFMRDSDGSLHSRTDNPAGGYFDFRLHQDSTGQWVFTEEGQLPAGFTQTYTLHPVEADGPRVRFVYLEDPQFLVMDITVDADSLRMDVDVAGLRHVVLELSG